MSWIPSRVAPQPDTDVLVVMQDETETWVDTAYLDKHGYWRCAGSHILVMPRVLYWQPFPALPDLDRTAAGGFPYRPAPEVA